MISRRAFLLSGAALQLSRSVNFIPGPVNAVLIGRGKRKLAIYSDPKAQSDSVLLTHFRRDVSCAATHARAVVVPAAEQSLFTDPAAFWQAFEKDRYHDYAMRNSKVLSAPLPIGRTVRGGDRMDWEGIPLEVWIRPVTRLAPCLICSTQTGDASPALAI